MFDPDAQMQRINRGMVFGRHAHLERNQSDCILNRNPRVDGTTRERRPGTDFIRSHQLWFRSSIWGRTIL
jgi:hypothetical protein